MRILKLEAENFKKIKVIAVEPKGNVIKISGANASGKSSTLDAIQLVLVGARGGPTTPVRKGEERGMVKADLGEFVVTRQWYEGGSSKGEMWIEAKDGRRYGTPQAVLDAVMGKISFDPLVFKDMDPKQQADEMRKLLDLDEPLTKLKAAYDADYDTRTEQTRNLTGLKAQRAALAYPEGLPKKKRDIDAMIEELAQASKTNSDLDRQQRERDDIKAKQAEGAQRMQAKIDRIAELQAEIAELQGEIKEDGNALARKELEIKKWKPLDPQVDAAALAEQISVARGVNEAIDRRDKADKFDEQITTTTEAVAKLNRAIDDNRQAARDLIAKAQYPIPGIGFSDDGVTFNDLPFAQASDAEKIKIAISMAMIGNPKLRVMRIKDGSLLDPASMKVVEEMADKHDYQVWLEVVDVSGKVGVYLVDGEVAAVDGEPVKEQPKPTLKAARKPREKKEDF